MPMEKMYFNESQNSLIQQKILFEVCSFRFHFVSAFHFVYNEYSVKQNSLPRLEVAFKRFISIVLLLFLERYITLFSV